MIAAYTCDTFSAGARTVRSERDIFFSFFSWWQINPYTYSFTIHATYIEYSIQLESHVTRALSARTSCYSIVYVYLDTYQKLQHCLYTYREAKYTLIQFVCCMLFNHMRGCVL